MNKPTRSTALVVSALALVVGVAGIAGATPNIGDTGNSSTNRVTSDSRTRTRVNNTANANLTNNNPQTASSGDVRVRGTTTVESATSGTVVNDSLTDAFVTVNQTNADDVVEESVAGGAGAATSTEGANVGSTGNNSINTVSSDTRVRTRVDNTANTTVTNNNSQTANSGDVRVRGNTTVGDVSSGDATNMSTTTFDVRVSQ